MEEFITMSRTTYTRQRVRQKLLHVIDTIFHPLDYKDSTHLHEPVSIRKLNKGDCPWHTIKEVLQWIIDTQATTMKIPQHRIDQLAEILSSISYSQKYFSTKKWFSVLDKL